MKNDLPYFKHYNSTHNEPRIQALLAEYGFEGYGRYWILCEIIASSPDAILDVSSRIIKLSVARSLDLNAEDFDSFIEFLKASDVNLIRFDNETITTNQLQEDYLRVSKKRKTDREDYYSGNDPSTDLPIPIPKTVIPASENIQSSSRVVVDQSILNNSSSSGKENPSETTTTIFINKCKTLGYYLDNLTAQKILNIGIESSWLSGSFTYPEYIAGVIQEDYANKPSDQKRKLFRTILAAEDRREAFPEWRKKSEDEATAQEERRQKDVAIQEKCQRIDQARANKPENCKCGHSIEFNGQLGVCPACGVRYFFDEEKEKWEKGDPAEFRSIRQSLKSHNQSKAGYTEEIDF